MADVFISYARSDNKDRFVSRLVEMLKQQGKAVWFDEEDIPFGFDFKDEFLKGVDESDAFVPILSPDYLERPNCQAELNRALENNKRIIPVLFRDIDFTQLDERMNRIKAIPFNHADFGRADAFLVETLNTADQRYVWRHTRLQVRAREWETNHENPSYLLRGADLRLAEEWQVSSARTEPQLTELQARYILASRTTEDRRQRTLLAAALIATVILAVLAVIAIYQSQVAQTNAAIAVANASTATIAQGQAQNNAATSIANAATAIAAQVTSERRADEAQSLALAANARGLRQDRNFDLALALALHANQIPNPPLDAQRVLAELAYFPLARSALTGLDYTGQPTGVRALAFSRDKKYLVSTFDDSGIRIWDLETGEAETKVGMGSFVIAFHPNEAVFATGGNYNQDYPIDFYDFKKQSSLFQLKGHYSGVSSLAFSPDGNIIVAGTTDGFLTVWDVETRQITKHFQVSTNSVNAFTFSPDSQLIALGSDDYAIHVWDLTSGEEQKSFANVGQITSLMFDTQGVYLFAAMSDGSIQMLEVRSGNVWRSFTGHTASTTSIDLSTDGRYLLSGSLDTTVRLWDVSSGSEIMRYEGHAASVTAVKFAPDNGYAVSGSLDGTIRFWNLAFGGEAFRFNGDTPLGNSNSILSVDFSPDERFVVFGSSSGMVEQWDLTKGARHQSIKVQEKGPVDLVVYSPSGDQLLTISHDEYGTSDKAFRLNLWNMTTEHPLESLMIQADYIGNARYSADGRLIFYQTYDPEQMEDNPNITHVYDLSAGREVMRFNAEALAITADGNTGLSSVSGMLGGIPYSDLTLWNLQTGEVLKEFHIPEISVFNPKYSPVSDKVIAFPLDGSSIVLWDLSANREIRRFEGHAISIQDFAFSSSGQYIASALGDNTIRLWDVATGLEIRRFEFLDSLNAVSSNIRFSPNDRYLLTGHGDNAVRLWHTDTLDSLIQWTYANRYVRQLTCEERLTYRVEPLCDAGGLYPTRTPYPTATRTITTSS